MAQNLAHRWRESERTFAARAKIILFLAANPANTSRLRLGEEVREIDEGLRRSKKREQFTLQQKWAVRPDDFRRALLDYEPNIVHFSGHGAGQDGIVLENNDNVAKPVTAEALKGLFELFPEIECVLLNACYSETQAEAISTNIKYVIGMSQAIGDEAAILFARGFYDALGAGKPIEFAYKLGCNALQMVGIPEYLTPVLKARISQEELATQAKIQPIEKEGDEYVLRLARNFNPGSRQYTSQFALPFEIADEALRTIRALSSPSAWKEFDITRDLSTGAWMGSESDTLVDTLYSLMLPTVVFNLLSGSLSRNFALLDWRAKLQLSILEAVSESFINDHLIAGLDPGIDYSPRVPDWRKKRQSNPQKYWWQGLSEDRLSNAIAEFTLKGKDSESKRILTRTEFHERYKNLFRRASRSEQQALGLAANALYGFTPKSRPIYWRLLIIQARLYHALLKTGMDNLRRPSSTNEAFQLFSPSNPNATEFPYSGVHDQFDGFEPLQTTVETSSQYLNMLVVPKLILRTQTSQEPL